MDEARRRTGVKVVVSEQVLARLGELHPDQRREVRRAIRDLVKGGGDTKELAGVLAGFHRLRVGRYRLVYRYGERRIPFTEVMLSERIRLQAAVPTLGQPERGV